MREKETSEGRETADGEGRRTRRHDPRRRERVLDAALDVLAEDGVAAGCGGFVCGPPPIEALADRTERAAWPPRPGGQTAR
ncbi:hypothetical protein [Streptomyces rishiriensis]|uniref:hypothetical protein n=1 Tax=Streptomyces rishiriensis TaxID=68264 RepID=UPI0037D6229D